MTPADRKMLDELDTLLAKADMEEWFANEELFLFLRRNLPRLLELARGQQWIPISELPPTEPRSIVLRMPQERLDRDCPAHPYTVSNPDYVRSGTAARAGYTHWMPLHAPTAVDQVELLLGQRWIPVSKELPEPCEFVLIYQPDSGSQYRVAYFNKRWMWPQAYNYEHPCDPTHWMPFPPDPEEESNEQ